MNIICSNCNAELYKEVKFCSKCGKQLHKNEIDKRTSSLNLIIVFYTTFLLFAVVSYLFYNEYPYNLLVEIVIESVFALMVVIFSLFDYKEILKLYKIPKLNKKILAFSLVFPLLSAVIVYFSIAFLNESLFGLNENYYSEYVYLDYPLFWAILFTAILPPIFEELGFRGFLFNSLQKVVSERITIIATAFIFALIHFSFISFIWIFPFGLILGYIRSKYNTIWYGIIIHFIHNFVVLMIDYYNFNNSLF
ncbi:CPBP family intramembrane glutamic endopeptidase [Winogradskyella sp.]|uniref:CPBP family intramembrane glutamic endopeptidase n=1 Tax=Winogradskyella sp. TaxID=1883156 RepID=UPI003AA95D2B